MFLEKQKCCERTANTDEERGHYGQRIGRLAVFFPEYNSGGGGIANAGASGTASEDKHDDDLKRRAEGGDPTAQVTLAIFYQSDDYPDHDDEKAVYWFKQAANNKSDAHDKDVALAQAQLGYAYLSGRGVHRDRNLGMIWLKKGARNGNKGAAYHLAEAYLDDDSSFGQRVVGLYWAVLAMDNGSEDAKTLIEGMGLDSWARSNARAIVDAANDAFARGDHEYKIMGFTVAAVLGNSEVAYYNLGFGYENGEGVPTDFDKALAMYEKAYEIKPEKLNREAVQRLRKITGKNASDTSFVDKDRESKNNFKNAMWTLSDSPLPFLLLAVGVILLVIWLGGLLFNLNQWLFLVLGIACFVVRHYIKKVGKQAKAEAGK